MPALIREFRAAKLVRLAVLLAAGFVLCLSFARAQTAPKPYADLVAQAESGDPATDYTALRNAYVVSGEYDGYSTKVHELYDVLWPAFQAKDCAKAIATSDEMLKIDYTLVTVHFIRSDCFKQMGDQARAGREDAIGKGLAHSLLSSGDGKSTATAYVVVTMAEERFVLGYLELKEEKQSLVNAGGHNFDLIEGTNTKTGEKASAFFNVDAMFGSLTRSLQKPK